MNFDYGNPKPRRQNRPVMAMTEKRPGMPPESGAISQYDPSPGMMAKPAVEPPRPNDPSWSPASPGNGLFFGQGVEVAPNSVTRGNRIPPRPVDPNQTLLGSGDAPVSTGTMQRPVRPPMPFQPPIRGPRLPGMR